MAVKGYPRFVVEFNNYSISWDDPMSLTSVLHGVPQLPNCTAAVAASAAASAAALDAAAVEEQTQHQRNNIASAAAMTSGLLESLP